MKNEDLISSILKKIPDLPVSDAMDVIDALNVIWVTHLMLELPKKEAEERLLNILQLADNKIKKSKKTKEPLMEHKELLDKHIKETKASLSSHETTQYIFASMLVNIISLYSASGEESTNDMIETLKKLALVDSKLRP